MSPLGGEGPSWSRALRTGAWLPIVLGLAASLGLAGLHFYQQEQLQRATNIIREVGRARQDLATGFLHVTLGGSADSPWQRDRGFALLKQALADFERATQQSAIEPEVVRAFTEDMERFRALLMRIAIAPSMSEADALALRLALYRLDASASHVDRLSLESLDTLRRELRRAFGLAFIAAVVLLLAAAFALHLSRRQALTAMRMLDSIAASSAEAIFAKDPQGRYLLYNKEASRLMGVPIAKVLGEDDTKLLPPEEAAWIMENDRRVMLEKSTVIYEEELTTVDGKRVFLSTKGPLLDSDGEVVGMFGIARDITQRKQVERAIQESRAQLEAVIESLNEGLVLTTPSGELLRMNRAALAIFECPGGCVGNVREFRDDFELTTLDGATVPFEQWPINRVLRGEHLKDLEFRVRRIDRGWLRVYSFGGRLLLNEEGQPLLALFMMRDVTPRHQAEESLRRTQRMEALGELAAGIAHDFNNILMAMAGNARLAEDELPPGHAARECLHEIVRASARAGDLVRSILLFSRAEEPQRRKIKLAALIDEALALVRPTTPSMIRFETRYGERMPPVSMDPSQMHQVIVNLVTNSVYAIVHGPPRTVGVIRLEVDLKTVGVDQPPGLALSPGRYVHLTISDNGGGMDKATIAKMFDPFFTTKPSGHGTGLGMSVVHGIVRNHDGAITVRSELDEGTSVEIYLPAAQEQIEPPAEAPATLETRRPRRILYIDDEESLVFLAVRFLRKRGHEVNGFVDAREAVRAFAAQPDRYDVVITDMSMPALSGYEVAKEILKVRKDVVILMMSGYVRAEDREAALALGVKDLLLKPSSIDELADAVDREVA